MKVRPCHVTIRPIGAWKWPWCARRRWRHRGQVVECCDFARSKGAIFQAKWSNCMQAREQRNSRWHCKYSARKNGKPEETKLHISSLKTPIGEISQCWNKDGIFHHGLTRMSQVFPDKIAWVNLAKHLICLKMENETNYIGYSGANSFLDGFQNDWNDWLGIMVSIFVILCNFINEKLQHFHMLQYFPIWQVNR